MTQLAALHARITGDSSGFVQAAQQAEGAAVKTTGAMGGGTGGVAAGGGLSGATNSARKAFTSLTSSPGMRMLPVQLSQVAQQAAAGTGVMRALTIQAADIGLAFGAVGAIVGTLATVAMPLIIGAFSGTEEATDDAKEALDRFSSALARANEAAEIAKKPIQELRAEYGRFANDVQETSRIVAQAALAEAMREFSDVAAELDGPLRDVESALDDYNDAAANLKTVQQALGEETLSNASAFAEARQSVDEAREAVVAAASEMGLSANEAVQLRSALDALADASGPEEVAEVAGTILALFDSIFTTTENIPPALGALISTLRQIQTEAAAAATAVSPLTGGPPGTDTGGGSDEPPSTRPQMRPMDLGVPEPGRGGSSGGGGGRSARAREEEKFERDLERLQEQLATEIELERQMNEERNEMLREAKEKELLTQEEYDDLIARERKRHNDEMEQLDVYSHGSRAAQMESFMGSMADAFASGNEDMMRIAKIFGAGEALINAWRTFSQVMADPSLPWFAKVPAAVSLLGSAMQAVSAIQGAGKGGSGQRSAGGAAGGNAGTIPAQEGGGGGGGRSVSLTLIGDNGFSRAQIVQIAEALNDSGDEGQELVQIRGRR